MPSHATNKGKSIWLCLEDNSFYWDILVRDEAVGIWRLPLTIICRRFLEFMDNYFYSPYVLPLRDVYTQEKVFVPLHLWCTHIFARRQEKAVNRCLNLLIINSGEQTLRTWTFTARQEIPRILPILNVQCSHSPLPSGYYFGPSVYRPSISHSLSLRYILYYSPIKLVF